MWGGGGEGVTLQKFQPLATRARERRENEEGPQRPEAGADCSDPAAWEKVKFCRPKPKCEELTVWFWWKLIEFDQKIQGKPGFFIFYFLKKSKTNKMLFFFFKLPYLVKIFKQ